MSKYTPILSIDFDGVLHSYTSGWKGPRNIPDPPVDGAINWLRSLLGCPDIWGIDYRYKEFKIYIFSSRSRYWGGRRAMKKWLVKHGLEKELLELIRFPLLKPPSFLLIDDRAVTFTGIFPTVEEIKSFKPWTDMKQEASND